MMDEAVGDMNIFEEMGKQEFREVVDERVDPELYNQETNASFMLDNQHEDNAFRFSFSREDDMFGDFENLIDMAGN